MCTTFAAFVSTGVTIAYCCVRLRNLCPHQQVSQIVWLFEGNHGSGKILDSLNIGVSKQPFHKRLNGHRSDLTHKSFLPVSQHFGLSDHSLEDFNRMKVLVIEQNFLWSDFHRQNRERFGLKNSVFYIRTVLTENNRFVCIFSFTEECK
jgi:hypothetical protein